MADFPDFEKIIRWDLVDADLAKGNDSEIIKILNREDK
jgi:hypothetical protein